MAKKKRDARTSYVAGYVGFERKQKLMKLAQRRKQTMTEVLATLIDQAAGSGATSAVVDRIAG